MSASNEGQVVEKHVVVAGSTGLVGREVVRLLSSRPGVRVVALVRRQGAGLGAVERVFDYDRLDSYDALGTDVRCDALLCCLGTTRAKAGSDEAFRRVDRDYVLTLLRRLKALPSAPVFGLVSSWGADRAKGLYLETKAEVEAAVIGSGLPYAIVRPSILLGDRSESRPGERVAAALLRPTFGVLQALFKGGLVDEVAPIEASQVAKALIYHALDRGPAPHMIASGAALLDLR